MVIYSAVFPIAALAFHLADLFRIVLVVLTEHGQKGLVVLSHTQKGVTHLFCGNIIVLVANFLIRAFVTPTRILSSIRFASCEARLLPDIFPDCTFHNFSSTSSLQLNWEIFPFTVTRHITGTSPLFLGAFHALQFFCYKIIPCRVVCRYAKYSLSPQSNPPWDFFQKSLVIHLYLRYICSAFPLSSLLSADRKKSNGIVTELRLQVAVFKLQVASLLSSQSLLNHSLAIISLRFNLGLSYFYYLCNRLTTKKIKKGKKKSIGI